MECRRKIRELRLLLPSLLMITASLASQIHASSQNNDVDAIFYEPFDEPLEGRWIVSAKEKYKGVWKLSKSEGHDDYGLLVDEKARKYALVTMLDEVVRVNNRTIVLQFEVRLQKGLECGGAYLKYLMPQEGGWKPERFGEDSDYSIMFGPDKCGSKNKVHFIFKHRNPVSGEYVEHHVRNPPTVPGDKMSHVYTAIVESDSGVRILVDGEEKKAARFVSGDDFEPALVPARTVADPNDKKPEGWDERPRIPDPKAVKPDDWDENAPVEIEDEGAVKPEGWLDDEPDEIDDPEATKPEDWDDEEDGEWEPPKKNNPKCSLAPGCGKWKRPLKKNPAYKGKWRRRLVKNHRYKGVWKPRQIPNPRYFETEKPDFEAIAAIGIEIWTMQSGILFDNILIADNEKVAKTYRMKTWKPKFDVEKEKQRAEDGGFSSFQKRIFHLLYKVAGLPFLDAYKPKVIELIEKAEKSPTVTIGVILSIMVIISTVLFKILFGCREPVVSKPNRGVAVETFTNKVSRSSEEKAADTLKENATAPPHRRPTRRQT